MTDDRFSRRRVLQGVGATGLAALAGCSTLDQTVRGEPARPDPRSPPDGPAETSVQLQAGPADGSTGFPDSTWLYNGSSPGPELRVAEGDVFEVAVENDLPNGTTVHWHGVPVANPMDGVPELTQSPIQTGETFTYKFEATPPGTYFYHSHSGLQLDRGLFGPLIVEEESPHVEFDREFTVVLDDYLSTAPRPLSEFGTEGTSTDGGGSGGMMGGGSGGMMGGEIGNRPPYDGLTIAGRGPDSPPTFEANEGERIRFRFVNASSATAMNVQLAGHPLTVTHADGRPVEPVSVDTFGFASGERYDAVVETTNPGAWELRATPINGNEAPAKARFVYGEDADETPTAPSSPTSRLSYDDLHSISRLEGVQGSPDRMFDLTLSAGQSGTWRIDGQAFPNADPFPITEGDHVRVRMTNRSPVLHPMHLHGHFFQVGDAVKDTVVVPGHMGQVTFDFVADNPGDWFFHCHNLYHLEAGMARVFRYVE
ncbi:MAG: multicopper oxidase family protein [Halanaeroarchaeum sp.]